MGRVAIYTRISLDRDGESVSPERQETLCRQYAASREWDVVAVYGDRDKSGWKRNIKRPGLEAALDTIRRGEADILMAFSLSRLGRRAIALLELLDFLGEHSASLMLFEDSIDTSTAHGKFLYGVVAGFAEMESEQTSERVATAHRLAAQQGRMHGGGSRQFGYQRPVKGSYAGIDPDEAAVIREAAARLLSGESLWAVASDLNGRGVRTTRGNEWTTQGLSQMLRAPRISGRRVHKGTLHPGAWEPILEPDYHDRLLAALPRSTAARRVKRHLLTGLAVCGLCGGALKTMGFRLKDGKPYEKYGCVKQPGHKNCGHVAGAKASMEAAVLDRLFTFLSDASLHLLDDDGQRRAELAAAIAADDEALVDLARDRYVHRTLPPEQFAVLHKELSERQARQRQALAALDRQQEASPLRPGCRDDLEAWWADATLEEQRGALAASIKEVRLMPAKHRGGNKFDADRVKVEWRWDLYVRTAERFAETATAEDWALAEEEYRAAIEEDAAGADAA